ncbi:MAG: hypothetical protein ACRDTD_21910 [Pseudonocardiaceae bacterium]
MKWDATIANRADGPGFTLTIGLDATDPIAAARTAAQFIRTRLGKAAAGQVIDLRVCTTERFETEAVPGQVVTGPIFTLLREPLWCLQPPAPRGSGELR